MSVTTLTIDELKTRLETAKQTVAKLSKWDAKKAKLGKCEDCYADEGKKKAVMKLVRPDYGDRLCCEHHFRDYMEEARKKAEAEVKLLTDEHGFRESFGKITRFSQLKDAVKAVRAVMRREAKRGYNEQKQFSEDELAQGQRLLQLLAKIKPPHSQFLDRGVAVSKDLYLSGTVETPHDSYGWSREHVESGIVLTALDEDERYKAIARVHLTIGEAERLRNLLVECIEHVRIGKMVADLQQVMNVSLPGKDEEE